MRVRLLVTVTATTAALALVASGANAAPAVETTHAAAPTGKPIIIGMPLALTGVISFYDQAHLASARAAVDVINRQGGVLGRPLRIVTGDTKSDLSLIAGVAREVVGKGAQFMIPTLDYDFGSPSARVGEANRPPIISISLAGDPRFGRQGVGPHTFNLSAGVGTEAAAAATFAKSRGWKRAYILGDPSISYSKSFTDAFKYAWSKIGGGASTAGQDTFMNSDPSIATQISRLRRARADFIFLGSYAPGGASATKQIRAAGINLPIVAGSGFDGTFWLSAVPNVKNFYVAAGGVTTPGADPNKARAAAFREYVRKYKKPPALGAQALSGYSAVEAFARAITRAKSTDTSKVLAQLNKFRDEPLAIGLTTWTTNCHLAKKNRTLPIVTFVNGKEKFVAEPKPLTRIIPPSVC
jgi:branched-chain amino acid transport system substrate-binding protein